MNMMTTIQIQKDFSGKLVAWQRQYGRNHLPWQVRDAYAVWLSEIMLQQTQVATVLDYYPKFIQRFPTVADLADAQQDEILALWAGLGYYSRARNLHKAAQQIMSEWGGKFPRSRQDLERLCGVGRSTAAAICAFAFMQREAILDGNVKRVLCRVFGLDGEIQNKAFERELWQLAEDLLPKNHNDMPFYTQGLMDLGATVCKRSKPMCEVCPLLGDCVARAQNRVGELPRKKASTKVKQQTLYWLILYGKNNDIWLVKRPQLGIWAGLYCVPCFEQLNDFEEFLLKLNLSQDNLIKSSPIQHRLTHRLLTILPFSGCIEMEKQPENGQWVTPNQLINLGLPKPLSEFFRLH